MATNDIYRVWSVDFPISRDKASPCDRLYQPYILTSGSFGCPDPFSAAFALAVQIDDELLRHMGHIDDAQHGDLSMIRTPLDSPSLTTPSQYTLALPPRIHKRAFISTPDIWVLEDPASTADNESCADQKSNISKTSRQTTPELSLCQSLPESSEKSDVVESIEPHVNIADNEINITSITPSALSSLTSQSPRKPRRAQQKKYPALLQALWSDTVGVPNLDQASMPSWAPALQRALAPKPNASPRAKRPCTMWARPTSAHSKSAALLTNKLAARRSRKTKKEWISQQERVGNCLRRMIEVRLAEINLLEAEVARLKMAISRCRECAVEVRQGGDWLGHRSCDWRGPSVLSVLGEQS